MAIHRKPKHQTFLIAALVILMVFAGGFLFGISGHNTHDCPIVFFGAGDCPVMGSVVAHTLHHIAGGQALLHGVVSYGMPVIFLLALCASLFFISQKTARAFTASRYFIYEKKHHGSDLRLIQHMRFLRWLAFTIRLHPSAPHRVCE